MTQILKTKDYGKFVLVSGNREVRHVKKVMRAMQKQNLMDLFPVVCSRENGKLKVLDGQGRLEAAKALGETVSYIVTDKLKEGSIGEVNSVQTSWSTNNYVNWYADKGVKAYVELRKFIDETKIPVTVAVQLITGNLSDGGTNINILHKMRTGKLEIGDMQHGYDVANVINVLKKHGIKFATHRSLVIAISRLCKTESFNAQRLEAKLEYQTARFVKCAEYMQYIAMIDDIYNYRAQASGIVSLTAEVKRNGEWTT